jgi:hypothetical protein
MQKAMPFRQKARHDSLAFRVGLDSLTQHGFVCIGEADTDVSVGHSSCFAADLGADLCM